MSRFKGRDIIISVNNNEEFIVLPVVPEPSFGTSENNSDFETSDKGSLRMIGNKGLDTISISSIFPNHATLGMRPGSSQNPLTYVNFFEKWRHENVPFRIIASKPDGSLWFNKAVSLDSFEYVQTKAGHIKYSLELTEYPFYKELL